MKFFIDTADVAEIKELVKTGFVDGVTTNPSLIAKAGGKVTEVIAQICELVEGSVSAEVTAVDYETMLKEAAIFTAIASNVTIKVPLTRDGLQACRQLADKGVSVNVTLCFSVNQALLAAKAGAAFVSPFVGRLDDVGEDGMNLVADIRQVYDNYPAFTTDILAASIRSPSHVLQAAQAGADVATLPPKILWQLYDHPLTDKGLDAFLKDWKASGQSIL